MKTLIINGSPRKNGDTVFLINKLANIINGEIKIVSTYYSNIKPCNDCRYCWKNNSCNKNDDMNNIIQYINEADNIIIASPLHFSEVTGTLLCFASRLQYLYIAKTFNNITLLKDKARKGFVILVGGGDGGYEKALSTSKCILKQMGAVFTDCVISHNTNNVPIEKDITSINKIKDIANTIMTD